MKPESADTLLEPTGWLSSVAHAFSIQVSPLPLAIPRALCVPCTKVAVLMPGVAELPFQQHSKPPFIFNCSPPCRPIKDEASRARITHKHFEGSRPSICFAGRLPFTHLCKNANNWAHTVGWSCLVQSEPLASADGSESGSTAEYYPRG